MQPESRALRQQDRLPSPGAGVPIDQDWQRVPVVIPQPPKGARRARLKPFTEQTLQPPPRKRSKGEDTLQETFEASQRSQNKLAEWDFEE